MDFVILAMIIAGAALAFALISNSRTHATRQREAEFFARHLRAGRWMDASLHLLTGPQ